MSNFSAGSSSFGNWPSHPSRTVENYSHSSYAPGSSYAALTASTSQVCSRVPIKDLTPHLPNTVSLCFALSRFPSIHTCVYLFPSPTHFHIFIQRASFERLITESVCNTCITAMQPINTPNDVHTYNVHIVNVHIK